MFLADACMCPGGFGLLFVVAEICLILGVVLTLGGFIGAFVGPILSMYHTRWEDWLQEKEEDRKRRKRNKG